MSNYEWAHLVSPAGNVVPKMLQVQSAEVNGTTFYLPII